MKPRSAVFAENKRDYVYKLFQGQAIRHQVVLGALRGDDIAVARGLSVGDTIIVDSKMLKPGTRVRPVRALNER